MCFFIFYDGFSHFVNPSLCTYHFQVPGQKGPRHCRGFQTQIREEVTLPQSRIIVRGKMHKQGRKRTN
ncbi:MAG: hypothetical protein ACOC9D_04455 [Thermodesulfobacteriota bacterium]